MPEQPSNVQPVLSYQNARPLNGELSYWRDGNEVVVTDGCLLPQCCVRCGITSDLITRNKTFVWHPRWVFVLVLVNVLVCAIVAVCLQRKVRVTYSVCHEHRRKARIRTDIAVGAITLGLLLFFGALSLRNPGPMILCGILTTTVAVVYGMIAVPELRAARYRDKQMWLKGACTAFLESLDSTPAQQPVHGFEVITPAPSPSSQPPLPPPAR